MSCVFKEETIKENGRERCRLTLENNLIIVVLEPWDGGRITRIFDKLRRCEHVWNNERTSGFSRYYSANYDNMSAFGIEEAFPTALPCRHAGMDVPFFGEVWSISWNYTVVECSQDRVAVRLSCKTSTIPAEMSKIVSITIDDMQVMVEYEIKNIGFGPFEYIMGVHPSFCIDEGSRIIMPEGKYEIASLYPEDLGSRSSFIWPDWNEMELSTVMPPDRNVCINFITKSMNLGKFSIVNKTKGSSISVSYDNEFFPVIGMWLIYGGWRGHNCVMAEVFTNWPLDLASASDFGTANWLEAGETEKTFMKYSVLHI